MRYRLFAMNGFWYTLSVFIIIGMYCIYTSWPRMYWLVPPLTIDLTPEEERTNFIQLSPSCTASVV
jgi:hypothetical protein